MCAIYPLVDSNVLHGVVLATSLIDNKFLEKIKTVTGADVAIHAGGELVATTLTRERVDSLRSQGITPETLKEEFKVLGREALYTAPLKISGHNVGFITLIRPLFSEEVALEQQQINVLIAIGGAILIIFILLTGTLIARSVTVPVEELVKVTCRLSRGDLTERANAKVSGEIGELAESFNEMADSLKARTDSLVNTLSELQTLYDVERAISLILNVDEATEAILRISVQALGAESGVLRLIDSEGYLKAVVATHPQTLQRAKIKVGEGVIGEVARTGTSKLIRDLSEEPCGLCEAEYLAENPCRTVICAPLKIKNQVVGVLELVNKTKDIAFSEEDLKLLSVVANRAAFVLENAQLFEETLKEKGKSEAILHSMEDGILALDKKGKIVLLNPASEDFFKVKEKEILGHSFTEVVKEKKIKGVISKALNIAKPLGEEIELKMPFERILQIRATPIETETQEIIGTVILIHDVTEIRRLERVKSDFVSTVSHELRTPLTSIKAYVATLLRE
ncbi:MAG: GAF domain-containing protein, partial [Candidatus Subteraquimicrobiales bacterium]|nr:GAF domain-containing protein [Candidatus Subteraquimicrobiales bacterium]